MLMPPLCPFTVRPLDQGWGAPQTLAQPSDVLCVLLGELSGPHGYRV